MAPSIALLSSVVAFWIALSSAVRLTASLSRLPNWASEVDGEGAEREHGEHQPGEQCQTGANGHSILIRWDRW